MPTPNYLLRDARLAKGISRKRLARELNVSPTTLYRWEKGSQDPYPLHQKKLSTFFGKDLSDLGFGVPFDEDASSKQKNIEVKSLRLQSSLPVTLTDVALVGREEDLAAVRQLVLTKRTVLVGLPGVGKTTLALELASDSHVRSHFLDGMLWASVGQKPNIDDLLRSWGKLLLDISPQEMAHLTLEKIISALKAAIGEQRLLLLIDDVWAAVDARMLFQVAGPNCGVLITTRSPLIGAELAGRDFYMLNELSEEAGLHLLDLLAPQAIALELEKARELVKAVGGLPLALLLMGRYLASKAWSGHTRRVAGAIEHLFDANARLTTGEHSLQSVIALSENLLSDAARVAFHTWSLFPPKPYHFSEQAALALAGCGTEELDMVVDLGLLESVGDNYRMHQTITDFGQFMLLPTERRAAEERLLTYILSKFDTRPAEVTWLEQEKQTIFMAIDAAEHLGQHEALLRLTLLIAPFLVNQGWLSLAQNYLRHACEVASQQHVAPTALCKLLVYTGKTFVGLGNFAEGLAAYHEGLRLARLSQDDACVAEILAMLTWQAHMWGEYDQADKYLYEGLEIATSLDLPDILWILWRGQGSQAWARGEYAQAEAAYLRGLSLVERLSDQSLADVTMYYCFLGVFEGERGHYAQAEAYFQQSIEAAQRYGFKDFIPFLLARRAMMRLMCDPSDELREELLQAIHAAQSVGSWGFAVYAHKALAQLELLRGNFNRAEEVAWQALAIIEPSQTKNRLGEHRTILAQIELARGHYAEAANYLQQALPLLRIYGAREDQALALLTQGEMEIGRGNLDAAEAAFQELFQAGPADFLAPIALGHYGMARVVAARQQWREARQFGEKSFHMLEDLKHVRTQEVRAWLETLPHPALHVKRDMQKFET